MQWVQNWRKLCFGQQQQQQQHHNYHYYCPLTAAVLATNLWKTNDKNLETCLLPDKQLAFVNINKLAQGSSQHWFTSLESKWKLLLLLMLMSSLLVPPVAWWPLLCARSPSLFGGVGPWSCPPPRRSPSRMLQWARFDCDDHGHKPGKRGYLWISTFWPNPRILIALCRAQISLAALLSYSIFEFNFQSCR